jgi:hypothetical protein
LPPKYKSGDGKTKVNDLPFVTMEVDIPDESPIVDGSAPNSAVLDGEYEGHSNQAISQISMALGAGSTAGLKGWYYNHVNFSERKIFLTNKQPTLLT